MNEELDWQKYDREALVKLLNRPITDEIWATWTGDTTLTPEQLLRWRRLMVHQGRPPLHLEHRSAPCNCGKRRL